MKKHNFFCALLLLICGAMPDAYGFSLPQDCGPGNATNWTAANGWGCNQAGTNINNTPSHPIVTTASAANGFQLSTSSDFAVSYTVSVSTTASIGSPSSAYVVLEISPTNSTNAASWQEIGRVANAQNITLAALLTSVQSTTAPISATIPVGYYARLQGVSVSGTTGWSFVSGQEYAD